MLHARGSLVVGPAQYASHVAVDREVRVFTVERRGIDFDARFVPPERGPARDAGMFLFVLAGAFALAGAPPCRGPALMVMPEAWYDGARGRRPVLYRATGEPFRCVEVRVRAGAGVRTPAGAEVRELSPRLLAASGEFAARALDPAAAEPTEEAASLLRAMAAEGLVPRALADGVTSEHSAGITRVWSHVAESYARMDASSSLKVLAAASALSLRQIARYVTTLQRELPLPGGGWRDAVLGLRLKLAVMFLACPDVDVGGVAAAVGYRHPEAMANAFQRAGLPPPTRVRAELLASRVRDAAAAPGGDL